MTARAHQLDTPRHTDADLVEDETDADIGLRFGGGHVPAVHADGGAGGGRSASELGYLQVAQAAGDEDDENVRELKTKVKALVDRKFKGDYHAGFTNYDANHDGGLDKDEIKTLLAEAGVGNGLTRGAWANGIIKKLDTSGDQKIQWAEFDKVFSARAPARA